MGKCGVGVEEVGEGGNETTVAGVAAEVVQQVVQQVRKHGEYGNCVIKEANKARHKQRKASGVIDNGNGTRTEQ